MSALALWWLFSAADLLSERQRSVVLRVIVGVTAKTPLMSSALNNVVVNRLGTCRPRWCAEDIVPKAILATVTISKHGYTVLSRAGATMQK